MSLTDEERKIVVQLQLEKAHSNFDQIPFLCEVGYWDNTTSLQAFSPLRKENITPVYKVYARKPITTVPIIPQRMTLFRKLNPQDC